MAHTISARKRIRQSETRRMRNKSEKSKIKTVIKKYNNTLKSGNIEEAETAMKNSISALYKGAGAGVIHKKQAARKASRIAKKLNAVKASAQ